MPATLTLPPQQPPQLPHKVPSAMKHSNFLPTPSSLPPQKPQQVKQVPLKSSITLQSRKQQDDDIQLVSPNPENVHNIIFMSYYAMSLRPYVLIHFNILCITIFHSSFHIEK